MGLCFKVSNALRVSLELGAGRGVVENLNSQILKSVKEDFVHAHQIDKDYTFDTSLRLMKLPCLNKGDLTLLLDYLMHAHLSLDK